MFIPELHRHLAVCGANEVERFTKFDRSFWNIISIREPSTPRWAWRDAKAIHHVCFHDAENLGAEGNIVFARNDDLVGILMFADSRPLEPLLIHCLAGQSRSTAVALALIVRGFVQTGIPVTVESVVLRLLEIRRQARPNALVLRLGLDLFLPPEQVGQLVPELLNHPQLLENRFQGRARNDEGSR